MAGAEGADGQRDRPGRPWAWLALALALIWSTLLRVPLVVNAPAHLDSDLAVDGLTLIDAARGHLRWHYPGTPHIGSASVVAGLPFALARGADPEALGMAGVTLNALTIAAIFGLGWRAYGPRVAAWSLLPTTFASTGLIWLSGRITGGHLLALAWHAAAFGLLSSCLVDPRPRKAAAIGVWSGVGLWNDSMFAVSIAGLGVSAFVFWWKGGRTRRGIVLALVFAAGLGVGALPRWVGGRVDPHDAYREQFTPDWRADVLLGHARILVLDCLPRLFAGHRLPGLEAEPGGIGLDGQATPAPRGEGRIALATVILGLGGFVAAIGALWLAGRRSPDPARRAVTVGLVVTSAVVLAGFMINRNIFNSDNYRYLVLLVAPGSVGLGLALDGLAARGRVGALTAALIGLAFAGAFTLDAGAWYRRLGWIDPAGRPVARGVDDPVLDWLDAHRQVTELYGGYWDVYRLSFLTGGRVRGVPSGHYPDRFSDRAGGRHPGYLLARPTPVGAQIRAQALAEGGADVARVPGGVIVRWP